MSVASPAISASVLPGSGTPPPSRSRPALTVKLFRPGERVVEALLFLAAASSVLITLGIVYVLVRESLAFFRAVGVGEFLTGTTWTPAFAQPTFGVLPLVTGTLVTTAVALLVAVPVGTVVAMWLSEYAGRKTREIVKPIVELLSAVPTVVFGYFALTLVTPALQKLFGGMHMDIAGSNMLGAGLVMGIMIVPYVASLSEDALRAVPSTLREGAAAMGSTRFHTCVRVLFPAALSGITSAYILAVARALGETMIVAIAAGNQPTLTVNPLEPAQTMTAYIVSVAGGDLPHGSPAYNAIFAVGLTLLLMTLCFNLAGFALRKRFREAY